MNASFPVKQNKFNGEISPDLYGDVQNPKYLISLRTCKNWLPIPTGALKKRPGTKFIAPTKAGQQVRLISFVFSDSNTFLLEVGNNYIRFYQRGQYVGVDGNLHTYGDAYVGGYFEVVTPLTTAMLPYLKFSQVGNVITICYGGQAAGSAAVAPQDLTYNGALSAWAVGSTPLKSKLQAFTVFAGSGFSIAAYANASTYNQGDRATTTAAGTTIEWTAIQNGITGAGQAPPNPPGVINAAGTGIQGNVFWTPSIDTAHQSQPTAYYVAKVVQDTSTGVVYESGVNGLLVLSINTCVVSDRPLTFFFNPQNEVGFKTLLYKIYKQFNNGGIGFLRSIPHKGVSTHSFTDLGEAPDYTQSISSDTDPFLVGAADSFPSLIGYLDQRRLWADSLALPSSLFLSKDGDLYNYDSLHIPGADTDAFNLLLISNVLEQVRSFVPLRRGVLLTGQGEFVISGINGGPISRSSRDAQRQSAWGSSWLDPVVIGKGLLFNTAKSNQVRDFYPLYGIYTDNWDGQDLTVAVRHLFEKHTLTSWAFQTVPYPVLWAARDDGTLVSLTYQHAAPSFGQQLTDGVVAWAQHAVGLADAKVEALCTVPEPPEDAVYMVVSRTAGLTANSVARGIEYLSSFSIPTLPSFVRIAGSAGTFLLPVVNQDPRFWIGSDCANVFDGRNTGATTMFIGGLGFTGNAGTNGTATASANVFQASDVGSHIVMIDNGSLGYSAKYTEYRAKIVGYIDPQNVTIEVITPMVGIGAIGATTSWGFSRPTASCPQLFGLTSLYENSNITVLADGDFDDGAVLAFGASSAQCAVTLSNPAMIVVVGIRITADAELLDASTPNIEVRNRFKNLLKMGFEVANTRDLFVGYDFDHLEQWVQRTVSMGYGPMPLATGYYEQRVKGNYNKFGRAAIRHNTPFPATITSVLREFTLGDT